MQFGFNAPTAGPLSATVPLTKLVMEGEAMGFDYATLSDHVVIPTDIQAIYPYSSTGEFPAGARAERHEQLIEVAFLAAKTMQKPHPPIWVGGESGPALRRTAKLGDAWYPIGTNPAFPLDSLARFKASVARLRKMTVEAGRKPDAIELALRCTAYGETVPAKAGDGERRLFSGKPAEIAADIKALRDIGVSHLDFGFAGTTVEAMLGEMQKFRKEVLALV